MEQHSSKYIIIGAGLSGLTAAFMLKEAGEDDFLILEGRDRVGGRVLTRNNIDWGAAWFNEGHTNLLELIDRLGLKVFDQYAKGNNVLVYNSMAEPYYFKSDINQLATKRLKGGTIALIKELSGNEVKEKVRLNTTVSSITEVEDDLMIDTNLGKYRAEKVVLTLPPKLALNLSYVPRLPENVVSIMSRTHTWMSNAIKVGIEYKRPFWREKGLSGMIVGQIGPVIELYDHTNSSGSSFNLMGFVNEGLRDESAHYRKRKIFAYLEKYLGKEAREYVSYSEKDWSIDTYTACENLKSTYISPEYGNLVFQDYYLNDKLLFSGTETARQFGGYLEGAVISGINAANKLLNEK